MRSAVCPNSRRNSGQGSRYRAIVHAHDHRRRHGRLYATVVHRRITDPGDGRGQRGWFGGRALINGPDVAAVFVTMESRLVLDNPQGPDDRSYAKFLFHVGADYYHADQVTVLMPAVAISRSKLIRNEWQAFNMTTFSDVGLQEPGRGISQAQLRANPPPIN